MSTTQSKITGLSTESISAIFPSNSLGLFALIPTQPYASANFTKSGKAAALPDFVKLAEAYGCVGIRANKPSELDGKIAEMLSVDKPVIFDCVVDKVENCYPMIPSGKPHNQMLLGPEDEKEVSDEGKTLV